MTERATSQALARQGPQALAGESIRTPQELAARMQEWQQVAHVLSPAFEISAIAPSHAINIAVVKIDPKVDGNGMGTDCYFQASIHKFHGFGENRQPQEVSLGKVGLLKIANAAGLSWLPHACGRTDDGRQPNYWSWTAVATYTSFDGSTQPLPPGSVEIDLRDGSPQIGGWTPELWADAVKDAEKRREVEKDEKTRRQVKPVPIGGWTKDRVDAARRFGLRLAEAKAINAAIRTLGVKQKYTVEELKKPFVVLRCSYVPDMTDPDVKRMVTAHALGATRALYGQAAFDTPRDSRVIDVTPAPPGASPTTATPWPTTDAVPANGAAPNPGTPAPDLLANLPVVDEPEPARELWHISFVGRRKDGKTYVVRFQERQGKDFETVDPQLATAAMRAKDAKLAADVEYERTEDGGAEQWVLLGLTVEGQPTLPIDDEVRL